MKYILLCSLFLSPLFACTQTWKEFNDSLIHYFNKGEYKKAIPFAEKTIAAVKNELGESDINYANSITYLAIIYNNTGDNDKAETLYLKAAALYKKISGETHSNYAISLINLGGFYENNGAYEKAEPLLVQATAIRKILGEDDPEYATSMHRLGVLYTSMGQYEKAETLLTQTIALRKKISGENDPDYATSLDKLAVVYTYLGNNKKAEPLLLQAITIREKALGKTHPDYTYSMSNLARLYQSKGQYDKAEPLFIESISIQKKILGEDNTSYATNLSDLGGLYLDMGEYDKAEPLFIQAAVITKNSLGENHPYYATSLNNLAGLFESKGQYDKAEPLYLQSKAIIIKSLGINHPYYASTQHNLALLYNYMGKYGIAEQLYIDANTIAKKSWGEKHPLYASCLHDLATLYESTGSYEKAETIHKQAAEIRKVVLGENHLDYSGSLNSLAVLYRSMGNYEKAESYFLQATAIRKKILGESHPYYATSLNNLALLYENMGSYEKAEELFIQSIAITKKGLGEDHPDYATNLNNLALLYTNSGDYEKAVPLFIQSSAISKKVLGDKNPGFAGSLNNLAHLYEKMGNYEKAEVIHLQANEIFKFALGEKHPHYASSLNNLAVLYKNMGKYEKADLYFLQATAIRKNVLGENHPAYATTLSNHAELYEGMGNYKKAEDLLHVSNKIEIKNLLNVFSTLSEKEKVNYLSNNILLNNTSNSFIYNYRKASPTFYKDNYNLQLLLKGLSLADTKHSLEVVRNSKDTGVQNLFNQWQANKVILAKQYALPITNRMAGLKNLETSIENLEKVLNRSSAEFRSQQNVLRITWEDVQKHLLPGEVAIEFVSFQLFNKKWTDSIIYAAYILNKKDSVPVFVTLCEEKQLGKYFSSTSGATTIKAIYRSEVVDEEDKPSISGDSLYALIWKPLMPYLQGVKKINYSPSGLLYKVAFHALPAGDSLLLMDLYELDQYTTTRQVAMVDEKKSSKASITLFGDCQYTMDSTMIVNTISANEKVNTLITANILRAENSGGWKNLSGTVYEIQSIQTLFAKNKINTNAFTQAIATEEQFKSLSGHSPSILHLATHGFFLPDPKKKRQEGFAADERNAFTLADDPLLRSGIVLSGANRVWSGQLPIAGREDGIVTAYEIAQMDLSKTDLVVLSACETALGDIKGNEGVFGLQRAFKMAGVKNMLLSLWKVPDTETAELMKIFYSNYLQGKTARQAFAVAQQEMRKKYSPYYWAAFVLIE